MQLYTTLSQKTGTGTIINTTLHAHECSFRFYTQASKHKELRSGKGRIIDRRRKPTSALFLELGKGPYRQYPHHYQNSFVFSLISLAWKLPWYAILVQERRDSFRICFLENSHNLDIYNITDFALQLAAYFGGSLNGRKLDST